MASNVVYINFSNNSFTGTGPPWNNSTESVKDLTNMDDEDGNPTTWDLTTTTDPTGVSTNGAGDGVSGTGDAAWVDESNVADSGHYVQSATAVYDFDGLDDGKTYTFEFFCASIDDRTTEISDDNFSTTYELDNYDSGNTEPNRRYTVTISDVSPSSGNITISWRNKAADGQFALLNAVRITESVSAGGDSLVFLTPTRIHRHSGRYR